MASFPCVACSKEVRPRQHAVSCDGCGRWQHRTCNTGITIAEYREAVKKGLILRFVCEPCLCTIPGVLRVVKERIGNPAVEEVVVDFEAAVWNGLRTVLPTVTIKGCVFHWTQAVWRHAQEYGLAATYHQRAGMYNYIRQLLALPFLPASHIKPAFQGLAERASTPEVKRLVNYVSATWMNSTVFSVASWCVFRQDVRTNNDVEGWHHRLNSKAGGCGLGFYRLVPLLRREASLVEMAVRTGKVAICSVTGVPHHRDWTAALHSYGTSTWQKRSPPANS